MGVDSGTGGVEEMLGSAGVPITFNAGSDSRSPACSTGLGGKGGVGWDARPMETGAGSESDFASKFKLVVGPGVPDLEPDVTGRDLFFFRFVRVIGGPFI